MNRLTQKLQQLKQQQQSGLVCYFTAGDPDFSASVDLFSQLGAAGADIIEVGVAFSDPVADGEVIQAAHARALNAGQTVAKTVELLRAVREKDTKTPMVLMTYLNPILQYGIEKLATETENILDAILIVDAPLEYQAQFKSVLGAKNIQCISMAAPTTPAPRLKQIAAQAEGFLYYVSATGLTGGSLEIAQLEKRLEQIKPVFDVPVAVGFGIKNQAQIQALNHKADLVIVGSALVETFAQQGLAATLAQVQDFASALKNT